MVQQGASQVVGAAVFLYLATQLDPAAFGVFALAVLLVDAFATEARTALVDLIVLRRDFSRAALSTVLFAATAAATLTYAALLGAAPALAAFFSAPQLPAVLAILGVSLLLAPLSAVYEALVVRDLRFGALAARTTAAALLSGALAVGFVQGGLAEWALVVQRLSAVAVSALALALLTPWAPALAFDGKLVRAWAPSFLKIWAGQLINFALGRAADLVIGARFDPGALGVYRVAARLVEIVQSLVTAPLTSVFVPVVARHRGDIPHQRQEYLEISALSALVATPVLAGLALVAGDLVEVLLDARYAGAAPVLALVAAAGLVVPFAYFRGGMLVSLGRPGLAMGLGLIDLVATLVGAWVGSRWGLTGAVAGILTASMAAAVLSVLTLAPQLQTRVSQLLAASAPPFAATASMAALLIALSSLMSAWNPAVRLPVAVAVGGVVYPLHLLLLHRRWLLERFNYLRVQRKSGT